MILVSSESYLSLTYSLLKMQLIQITLKTVYFFIRKHCRFRQCSGSAHSFFLKHRKRQQCTHHILACIDDFRDFKVDAQAGQ